MSYKYTLNKNHWNDSMHIFFNPKLAYESKHLFPHIIDSEYREQNFLTVNKKPIMNVYERISIKKDKRPAVLVIGEAKQVQKRTQTTQNKRKQMSVELEQQLMRNYRETISQINHVKEAPSRRGINFNKLFPQTHQKEQKQIYYFYIGPGNNAELIQQILLKRKIWVQTTSSLYHFRWEQARPKYQNSSINKQLINHLPNHEALTDKVGLVNSLKLYCEKNGQQMFNIIPNCFYFDFASLESCQNQIKRFIQFYYDDNERNQKPEKNGVQKDEIIKNIKQNGNSPRKLSKNQSQTNMTSASSNKNYKCTKKSSNFVPSVEQTKRKQQLKKLHIILLAHLKTFYNFVDMSVAKKQNPYTVPIHNNVYGNTSLWLLKPADLNRGRGIHLFRTIQQLGSLLKAQLSKHEKGSFLVQKYIQKPMLIKSRKFDIRVYSLITQNKQLYFFKQGYIRTSSTSFEVNSPNYFTHLTNNAIQKYSKNYGQFEQGNILPLNYLFKQCGMSKNQIYSQIKNKIKLCTKAGFSKMFHFSQKLPNLLTNPNGNTVNSATTLSNKIKYFQIFGYDFMLDETGHIWLIEVNTNPCIQLSNKWLKQIIPRMLDDAFKLTLDKVFYKKKNVKQKQNPQEGYFYSVPEYCDADNMWEYLDTKQNDQAMVSNSIIN